MGFYWLHTLSELEPVPFAEIKPYIMSFRLRCYSLCLIPFVRVDIAKNLACNLEVQVSFYWVSRGS